MVNSLIMKAAALLAEIRRREKEIGNPVLVLSLKAELENLIDYLEDDG